MLQYIKNFFKKRAVKRTALITLLTIKWLIISMIIVGCVAAGAAFGYASALVKDDPVRSKDMIMAQIQDNATTGFVYFNDDKPVGQLRSDEDRRLANLQEIPQLIKDATLSIEDKNFYNHNGIDTNGLLRAIEQKIRHEDVQTGGSTITQQLARRMFLTLDKEISRKFKEILLSLRMERLLSKDEILLAYLNKIPYGNGSTGYNLFGIKAAAKGIFDKDNLNDLNIAQCAYLAGLPQSPSNYSAFSGKGEFDVDSFKKAMNRQQLVLKRMLQEQKITDAQYQDALAFDIRNSLGRNRQKAYTTYPYLMIEVENNAADIILKQQYPNLNLDTDSKKTAYNDALKDVHLQMEHGGYQIYTTIDKTIYDSMQDIAKDKNNFTPDDKVKGIEQIGGIMLDNRNGSILGMIEGRDFYAEQSNHATQTYRQPGSTMKPIAAYVPAIEKGAISPGVAIDDVPIILKDPSQPSGFFVPSNWDSNINGFHGLITARLALNQSYNIPAIRLFLNEVGIKEAWDYAKKMGINSITPQDNYAQTGVIGGLSKGVSVKELTNAYMTIANHGVFNDAYLIRKIVDGNGKTVYEHPKNPSTVFSQETAYIMTDMMRTVVTEGTATDLMTKFKHYGKVPIVGKTGSTQDDADAWFMGYSPDITVGVWAGYDQPIHKLVKPGGTGRAKNIWALIMDAAINKKPELFPTKEFVRPANIVDVSVSNLSGKLPSDLTKASGHIITDIFNKKYIPTTEDDVMVNMKYVTYNNINYLPNPGTPPELLKEKVVVKHKESIVDILKKITDIMDKTPAAKRKRIESFVPADIADYAPDVVDPRTVEELGPDAPSNLLLTRNGEENRISFSPSGNVNVVSYRLYRSVNKENFQILKDIAAGQESIFTDTSPENSTSAYYITAVNLVGKESAPSRIVALDDVLLPTPGVNPGGDPGGNPSPSPSAGPSTSPGHGTGTSVTSAPSAPAGIHFKKNSTNLQIDWKANPAVDQVQSYNIFFSTAETGAFRKLGSSGALPQYKYTSGNYNGYYRVSAVNQIGESAMSTPVLYLAP
jgi:penicillin-binding protein